MSASEDQVRGLIAEEAAQWFVANRAGLPERDRDRFTAWLRASPAHVEEYLGVAVISGDLREACAVSAGELEALMARARQEETVVGHARWPRGISALGAAAARQFRPAAAALSLIVAVAIAALVWWHPRTSTPVTAAASVVQHFATAHGEQRSERLSDGSALRLNTDTSVTVEYSETQRRVTLVAGEAQFEVAHEAARTFRVLAGEAQVIAVGTRFDVRLRADATVVTVAEGRVEVGPATATLRGNAAGGSLFVQLGAEQQIRYAPDAWPATPEAADAGRTTAWLHRQISFEREPLQRVASEFNRYSPKTIEIATPALRNLKISGVFATDDTDAFVAFLRSLDGVRVEVTATHIRVSQGAAAPVH